MMPLVMEVGLGPVDFVFDVDPATSEKRHIHPHPTSPKGGRALQFSAHLYCGQTAECINMPLGMDVSLSPGDFVLDWDPCPTVPKGAKPPIFGPSLLWPNGCMDQDAIWYGVRPRPTIYCVRWGPSSLSLKGHSPQFSANIRCEQTA